MYRGAGQFLENSGAIDYTYQVRYTRNQRRDTKRKRTYIKKKTSGVRNKASPSSQKVPKISRKLYRVKKPGKSKYLVDFSAIILFVICMSVHSMKLESTRIAILIKSGHADHPRSNRGHRLFAPSTFWAGSEVSHTIYLRARTGWASQGADYVCDRRCPDQDCILLGCDFSTPG